MNGPEQATTVYRLLLENGVYAYRRGFRLLSLCSNSSAVDPAEDILAGEQQHNYAEDACYVSSGFPNNKVDVRIRDYPANPLSIVGYRGADRCSASTLG